MPLKQYPEGYGFAALRRIPASLYRTRKRQAEFSRRRTLTDGSWDAKKKLLAEFRTIREHEEALESECRKICPYCNGDGVCIYCMGYGPCRFCNGEGQHPETSIVDLVGDDRVHFKAKGSPICLANKLRKERNYKYE